jgi:hypothetical protein
MPVGCSSASLGLSYDATYRLTFNSPQVPVLAVITKDPHGSMISYLGTGSTQVGCAHTGRRTALCRSSTRRRPLSKSAPRPYTLAPPSNPPSQPPTPNPRTQGRIKHRMADRVELCYAPASSDVSVTSSAVYSTGMQPGSASWTFAKSVQLPAAYSDNRVVMFNGDSVDATWSLVAHKAGTDVNYQGVVSGTISVNNPTRGTITVNQITSQVTNGGPIATVACPVGVPFSIPACSMVNCQYTAYYPTAPPAGVYTAGAQVQYQVREREAQTAGRGAHWVIAPRYCLAFPCPTPPLTSPTQTKPNPTPPTTNTKKNPRSRAPRATPPASRAPPSSTSARPRPSPRWPPPRAPSPLAAR